MMLTADHKVVRFRALVERYKIEVRKERRKFEKFAAISAAWKKAQGDSPL